MSMIQPISTLGKQAMAEIVPDYAWLVEMNQTPRDYMIGAYSDAYKETNGFRPRFLADMTFDALAEGYYRAVDEIFGLDYRQ